MRASLAFLAGMALSLVIMATATLIVDLTARRLPDLPPMPVPSYDQALTLPPKGALGLGSPELRWNPPSTPHPDEVRLLPAIARLEATANRCVKRDDLDAAYARALLREGVFPVTTHEVRP